MNNKNQKYLLKFKPEEKRKGEDLDKGEKLTEQQTRSLFLVNLFEDVKRVSCSGS